MAKKNKRRGQSAPRGVHIVSAPAGKLRRVLRQNIARLIEARYPLAKFGFRSKQWRQVAEDAKITISSVERALDARLGLTIDVVADLAAALEVPPADLLREHHEISSVKPDDNDNDGPSAGSLRRA